MIYIDNFIEKYISDLSKEEFISEDEDSLWERYVKYRTEISHPFKLNLNYKKNEKKRRFFINIIQLSINLINKKIS